jgi:hypothetical protein
MNDRQKQVYAALRATPPTSRATGWGSAYFQGFEHPDMRVEDAGPAVGYPGSEARAAFMAGRDAARAARKAQA